MNEFPSVAAIVLWAVAMIVGSMWVARDARKRGKGVAVVILCLLTFPAGILVWLLLRPSVHHSPDRPWL